MKRAMQRIKLSILAGILSVSATVLPVMPAGAVTEDPQGGSVNIEAPVTTITKPGEAQVTYHVQVSPGYRNDKYETMKSFFIRLPAELKDVKFTYIKSPAVDASVSLPVESADYAYDHYDVTSPAAVLKLSPVGDDGMLPVLSSNK